LGLGYGIGVTIKEHESSMLGKVVSFDESTPAVIRLLCLADVLIELMKGVKENGTLPLDELLTD
jgi:intracellular multiplication protein IcmS